MKRWILTLAAAAVGVTFATASLAAPGGAAPAKPGQKGAQKGQKGPKGAGGMKRLETALAKLNLSADQKTKVDKLIADAKADAQKQRTATGTPEEKKAARRTSMKGFRDRLNAILTPAQQAQLKESMPKRPVGARPGKAAKGGKPA